MQVIKIILLIVISGYLILGVAFYLFQEKIIFQAEVLPQDFKFHFPGNVEERNFDTPNDGHINALHFKTDSPKGVILYFHGNAGSLLRWGEVAQDFTLLEYDVLIFDYRGYGKSTGKRSMQIIFDDGQFLYDKLKKEYAEKDIVIFGRSLGSGPATWLASKNDPAILILETPFNSLTSVGQSHYPVFPIGLSLRYPFPSEKYIKDVQCPVYIFHGTEDSIVPYKLGKRLYDAISTVTTKELITINGGGHNDLIQFDQYWRKMKDVLARG